MGNPSSLDAKLTQADVEALFQAVLRRAPDDPAFIRELIDTGATARDLLIRLRACDELHRTVRDEHQVHSSDVRRDPARLRCPPDLAVTAWAPRRVLMVGSCLMEAWADRIMSGPSSCACDLYLLGAALPDQPPAPIADYDFLIVQLPLRSMLPDGAFARLAQADLAAHRRLFGEAVRTMRMWLGQAMQWNRAHGLLTFVLPFIVPQQNAVGRLLDRYEITNPVYFVERLNEALARELAHDTHAYFFDLNEMLGTHGRRLVQEDFITAFNHGGLRSDHDSTLDGGRMDPPHRASDVYKTQLTPVLATAWHEMVAMARTVRGIDAVKLVVIDLDDTLWRGVVAEYDPDELPSNEGWPVGLWEALLLLKRRGVLLAIISQNDEARVLAVWDRILLGILRIEDFAARRIDWRPKSDKMAEILAQVNLLPDNVVFIDDNPLQRAEIAAAFPAMRVLGGDPFTWRHILLWAPETQVAVITAESARRTEMVQAQVVREEQRGLTTRAEFLASAKVQMTLFALDSVDHPRFARALELINKTNQFNTTGERWTLPACTAAFAAGVRWRAFDLSDIHTSYGLVGVLITDGLGIRQFVMSCRVIGLDAEIAAVAHTVMLFRALGRPAIEGRLVETPRNLPCRLIYEQCGFTRDDRGVWQRATTAQPPIPAHITLTAPPPAR